MSHDENLARRAPLSPFAVTGRLVLIGGVFLIAALALAYAGGWLTPDRLTPTRMVAALSDRGGESSRSSSQGHVFHRGVRW